jgi:hypothetical protein
MAPRQHGDCSDGGEWINSHFWTINRQADYRDIEIPSADPIRNVGPPCRIYPD